MIERNLGVLERIVRFMLGAALGVWVLAQPSWAVLEWVALVAALFLLLNAFYGRCYLWNALGFNSCGDDEDCKEQSVS